MEYVLSALLLHKLGKDINEKSVSSILKAAGAEVNEAKVKALIASLGNVDIKKAVEEASRAPVAVASPSGEAPKKASEEKKEERSEEEKEKEAEKAAAGLGSLFG